MKKIIAQLVGENPVNIGFKMSKYTAAPPINNLFN